MAGIGEAVVLLEEQPVLVLGVYQRPTAVQLATLQEDAELAALDPAPHQRLGTLAVEARTAVLLGRVDAGVPHDHLPPAVFALGDDALERGVLQRMVLGHHRQPAFAAGVRGAVGDRPRFEDAVDFQAEVVVQPTRGVLLDHERQWPSARRRLGGRRFSSAGKVALGAVVVETRGVHPPGCILCMAAGTTSDRNRQPAPRALATMRQIRQAQP